MSPGQLLGWAFYAFCAGVLYPTTAFAGDTERSHLLDLRKATELAHCLTTELPLYLHSLNRSNYSAAMTFLPERCLRYSPTAASFLSLSPNDLTHRCLSGRHVVLVGDSAMFHSGLAIRRALGSCALLHRGLRCNASQNYFNFPYVHQTWAKQGPQLIKSCQDCIGCHPIEYNCSGAVVEFIGMEYSWDDEVISPKYNSTQENIFLAHLAGKSPDLIVLNSGLHDAGRIPLPAYAENLHSLGRMIRPFTHKGSVVVWLGTNDVHSDLIPAQYCNLALRETILALNKVAGKVTRVYGMIYLDAFPLQTRPLDCTPTDFTCTTKGTCTTGCWP